MNQPHDYGSKLLYFHSQTIHQLHRRSNAMSTLSAEDASKDSSSATTRQSINLANIAPEFDVNHKYRLKELVPFMQAQPLESDMEALVGSSLSKMNRSPLEVAVLDHAEAKIVLAWLLPRYAVLYEALFEIGITTRDMQTFSKCTKPPRISKDLDGSISPKRVIRALEDVCRSVVSGTGSKSNDKTVEATDESANKLGRSNNEGSKHGNEATLGFIREWVKVNMKMQLFKELVAVGLAVSLGYQMGHGDIVASCFTVHMLLRFLASV